MEKWLSLPAYMKEKYGRKLYRVPLSAGFTCPTRDGTKGKDGCIFCSRSGSGEFAIFYHGQKLTVNDLIYNHQNAPSGDYIAYFQAYTNTYGPIEKLKHLFKSALEDPLFAGIAVATRSDCLEKEVVDLFQQLKNDYPHKIFIIELGLQTIHEDVAKWMRRGYGLDVFDDAVRRLNAIGMEIVVHVIIGLHNETQQHNLQTIRHLNTLPIHGIKIQSLQYLKNTDLGDLYLAHPDRYHVLTKEEYVSTVAKCIASLRKDIVIHRLTGDGDVQSLIAPLWAVQKGQVINEIRHYMKEHDLYQGCQCEDNEMVISGV